MRLSSKEHNAQFVRRKLYKKKVIKRTAVSRQDLRLQQEHRTHPTDREIPISRMGIISSLQLRTYIENTAKVTRDHSWEKYDA